jgi:hypothetical protein
VPGVLAESGSEGFSLPVLVAAGGVAIAWVLVAVAIWVARRPPDAPAAPATMDLGPEPPAIAAVLCDDYEVCAETAPATLLDLAARDVIALDEVQPGETICRVPEVPPTDVTPFERHVLVALAAKAVRGVVPATALTTGTDDASARWHRALAQLVVADAQARGLTHDRWPKRVVVLVGAGVAAVVGLLVVAAEIGGDAEDQPVVAGIAAGVAIGGALLLAALTGRWSRSLAQQPTPAGAAAESRWRGVRAHLRDNERLAELPPAAVTLYGRHLAYAAGFGLAAHAVEALPFGAEDDHRAWSSHGGRWRRVRVRYPRVRPPAWGRHPALATFAALVWGAGSVFLLTRVGSLGNDLTLVVSVVLALPLAWSLWVLTRAVPDLFTRHTVTGTVLRCRTRTRASSSRDTPRYWYYVAIDDGTRDRVVAFRVSRELYAKVHQGQTVTADVTPRLGYVRSFS